MNHRNIIGAVVLVVLLIGAGFYFFHKPKPLPETQTFTSGRFSFTYPIAYKAQEYASGVAAIGGAPAGGGFIPLIDVVQYKNDLQSAAPANFDAFAARQALLLCATDSATERISCANPKTEIFQTTSGLLGKQITLELTRKNVKTGVASTTTYGPIYVFDVSQTPDPGEKPRYEGVFVYPDFSTFLLAPATGDLVKDIALTIVKRK